MNLGVPRHREPSGLPAAPVPHRSSPFFSAASSLFPHFSPPKCPTTPLLSSTCALLQKQRRGVPFLRPDFPVSRFISRCPRVTPLESVFTQNSSLNPLESVFTHYIG